MPAITRYEVLGCPVDTVDMRDALDYVADAVKNRTSAGFVLAVNPEKVYILREDEFLRDFFQRAALLLPDGIGMVRGLKILHKVKVSRCPGADLMQNICAEAPERGYRIFIYGASEEVNRKSCEILQQRYPGINIAGRANGFVKPEEMDTLVQKINDSATDILFIALGSPLQERWMSLYADKLTTVKICQGIGGTLDTVAGKVKRASRFWQDLGLEWFYRMLCQPCRFKRQLHCFKFGFEVYKTKISGKRS